MDILSNKLVFSIVETENLYFCTIFNIKLHTMKKNILLFAFSLATALAMAQVSMDCLPFHSTGYGSNNIENLYSQRTGELVSNIVVGTPSGSGSIPPSIEGNVIYKINPYSLSITDTMFVADSWPPFFHYARNPRGEGNLRIDIESDGNGGTQLRIACFPDDGLDFSPGEDIVVPLCEGEAWVNSFYDSYLIDSQGNLILKYYIGNSFGGTVEGYMARIGLDGTLMHQTLVPESLNLMENLDQFSESPLRYYSWKRNDSGGLSIYVLDSDFQLENMYVVPARFNHGEEEFHFFNANGTFAIPKGGGMYVAAPYEWDSLGYYQYGGGAAVARYDLRTMQQTHIARFNDHESDSYDADCKGLHMTGDGNLYFLYREQGDPDESLVTVAKLDGELNVLWKRYCQTDDTKIYDFYVSNSFLFENEEGNGGIGFAGYSTNRYSDDRGVFFYFIHDDGFVDVGEDFIRPYACYPNPASDYLRLQYSPDVQPKQIELYDLQGRLVRSQGSAFETFDLGQLPTGTYTMRVTMDDGQVFSDKVVKE